MWTCACIPLKDISGAGFPDYSVYISLSRPISRGTSVKSFTKRSVPAAVTAQDALCSPDWPAESGGPPRGLRGAGSVASDQPSGLITLFTPSVMSASATTASSLSVYWKSSFSEKGPTFCSFFCIASPRLCGFSNRRPPPHECLSRDLITELVLLNPPRIVSSLLLWTLS